MLKNVRQDSTDQTAQSNAPTVLMEWTVNKKCSCGNKDCNHVFGCFKGRVTLLKDNVPIENCINN